MAFEELLNRYLDYLTLSNYSPLSIKKYRDCLGKFLIFCQKEKGIQRIQDVTSEILRLYQNKIYAKKRIQDGKPLSMSFKYHMLITLKNFFKFLVRKSIILYSPAESLDLPKMHRDRLREALKESEIKKILKAAGGHTPSQIRDRAILELLYSTGIRNKELRSLEVQDVDLKEETLRIREGKGYFGHKERLIPMGHTASGYLGQYLMSVRPHLCGSHLFVTDTGRPLRSNHLIVIVKKYTALSGIKRRVYPHLFRHSFATHLLRHGADIRAIQEMLGHACLDSTVVYAKCQITDLKRIHRKTHPRERGI